MSITWNLWHGCHKLSPGCANCYAYRTDTKHGRDPAVVQKTGQFSLPVRKKRNGSYAIGPGEVVYTCFTSDFLLPDADEWRPEAWEMIRQRQDLTFLFITKRIDRLSVCLPSGWGDGWDNVVVGCTVENQERAAARVPLFMDAPIRHKFLACEPLLEALDLTPWLGGWLELVMAGGESGQMARICDYEWVRSLRRQCEAAGVAFHFKQTGARFRKDGRLYAVPRPEQHRQAARAGIDWTPAGMPERQW